MFIVQEAAEVEAQPCFLESLQSHCGVHSTDHQSCNKYRTLEQCACFLHMSVCVCICSWVFIGVPLVCFFFVHGQSALAFQTVSASKNLSHLFFQEDQSCSTLCLMPLRSFVLIEDGRVRSILKKRLLAYCPLLCFCCFEFSQMILWPYL